MKIIIIESELYLAQSIGTKLGELGFEIEIYSSIKEAMKSRGDVYLLSTNLPGQNSAPLIEEFKEKIIILMVSYINNDTVSEPLRLGAKDYIVKPFMIEELLRKIRHYKEYQDLRHENLLYRDYTGHMLKDIKVDINMEKINPPMVLFTNYPRLVDKIIFLYSQVNKMKVTYIPLICEDWKGKIENAPTGSFFYITDLQLLKKIERDLLFEMLQNKIFIIATTSMFKTPYETIEIKADNKLYDENEILTIDEYVRFIVSSFQHKFPDTELSKKLGISRKSLWEKRKKYGIFKKK
jgi:DNA-binding NtrC family response regulator